MLATPYSIDGLVLFEPRIFADERGAFFESFNARQFQTSTGFAPSFVQDNQSISRAGVVRGLHYQIEPHAQGKLVRVLRGSIFDVAVDIRQGSVSFGRWAGVELSADNNRQFWIPPSFAHGFLALEDDTHVLYKTTNFWDRESERAIRWDDPQIGIAWPLHGLDVVVSGKDSLAPSLSELLTPAL